MRSLWHTLKAHRRAAWFLAGLWVAVWIFTLVTWIDEPGQRGMHPAAVLAQLVVPLAAGGLARWWQRTPLSLSKDLQRLLVPILISVAVWFFTAGSLPVVFRISLSVLAILLLTTLAGVRGLGASTLAGLLVMEANVLLLFLQSGWLMVTGGLPPEAGEGGLLFGLLEFVEWTVFLGGLGLILGWLAGLVVALATTWPGGGRRQNGPPPAATTQ